jgi:hypothetical protein
VSNDRRQRPVVRVFVHAIPLLDRDFVLTFLELSSEASVVITSNSNIESRSPEPWLQWLLASTFRSYFFSA